MCLEAFWRHVDSAAESHATRRRRVECARLCVGFAFWVLGSGSATFRVEVTFDVVSDINT